MDYVGDYVFNGTAFGFGNPFVSVASPYAPLMSGYMGSVTTSGPDTNTITLRHLVPGVYDIYLYVCGRSDGQGRVDVFFANDQAVPSAVQTTETSLLIAGQNYVHLTPTVTTNGVLKISLLWNHRRRAGIVEWSSDLAVRTQTSRSDTLIGHNL